MRNVRLDPPAKRQLYLKADSLKKFDSIKLPEYLPPLPAKQQVNICYGLTRLFRLLISKFLKKFHKGPFREPLEVRKQRYRPLSPSLRCETDYESLEKARKNDRNQEWTGRLHDTV
jgi:hypothetical protein